MKTPAKHRALKAGKKEKGEGVRGEGGKEGKGGKERLKERMNERQNRKKKGGRREVIPNTGNLANCQGLARSQSLRENIYRMVYLY